MSFIIIIVSPITTSTVTVGEPVDVMVSVSEVIEKVEFFADGVKFGERLSEPYTLPFTPGSAGAIELRAVGTNSEGAIPSAAVVVISKA